MTWRRAVANVVYYLFARYLPWSPRPGGQVAKLVRRWCVERMLDSCGRDVNVEHGAHFGSGSGIVVGDRSGIGLHALIMGPLTLGNDVMMAPKVSLISQQHGASRTDIAMSEQGFIADRRIHIEDDVWLGTGTIVLPGVRIGRGSIIGAGSVVVKDIPEWSLAAGNPAQVKRRRGADEPRQEWRETRSQ